MHDIYCFREDKKAFGRNLKSLMEAKKMTVEKLADKVGYGVNTINKWRSGERIPSIAHTDPFGLNWVSFAGLPLKST